MPVGAKRHAVHREGVAGERGADGGAGVGVPQPQRLVLATGDDAAPVGAKRHTPHGVGVTAEGIASAGFDQIWIPLVRQDRMLDPPGPNATVSTLSPAVVKGSSTEYPESTCHRRTVPSALPVMSTEPRRSNGSNATLLTGAVFASWGSSAAASASGLPTGCALSVTSHIHTVVSALPTPTDDRRG